MPAIISLTTDFGLTDGYVASMKGVILGINPDVHLVDVSHSVSPQNIVQAAFVLWASTRFFPRRSIHLVVVDPGVGTERRAVIFRTPSALYVAPDNGVMSYVIRECSPGMPEGTAPQQQKLGPDTESVVISNPHFLHVPVSNTFHGRDIFAPVAAHLSRGLSLRQFGEATTSLMVLPLPHPQKGEDGSLTGHILHIDSFGNLITDVKKEDLPPEGMYLIRISGQTIKGLSRTYADGPGLGALIGSNDYLEIFARDGSAQAELKAGINDEIKVSK